MFAVQADSQPRTLVERPAARTAGLTPTSRIMGLSLTHATRSDVADLMIQRSRTRTRTIISFINAHCINVARTDRRYARIVAQSDLLLPDGAGMRIAAWFAGEALGENLNGTDLFPVICERAARAGKSIYLLGGGDSVAAAAAARMQALYPGLRVAGAHNGFPSQAEDVVSQINRSGADILFVGMGVPLQEKWIDDHQSRLNTSVILGVGGLFDYWSGRIPRAPMVWRKLGCEWVWRLIQEPVRLAERYLIGNLAFLARVVTLNASDSIVTPARHPVRLKRALDIALSGLALISLAPLMVAIATAIRAEDGGPAFFPQTRIGENGRPFTMLKYRSMAVDAEHRLQALLAASERDGVCFKMKRDPRITRIGAFLRRASLDELPQLINVLRGEMSLVGPRPALPKEVATYDGGSWLRLRGKPGLTCIWQVSGRADIPFARQVQMDVAYLRTRSLLTDLGLLFKTVPAVLSGRGAY